MKTSQVDLEDIVHSNMKMLAWEKGITIKSFIVEAIKEKIAGEFKIVEEKE